MSKRNCTVRFTRLEAEVLDLLLDSALGCMDESRNKTVLYRVAAKVRRSLLTPTPEAPR